MKYHYRSAKKESGLNNMEAVTMEAIKAPRGTRDVLGDESWKWAYVTDVCRGVADDYGYREVHLPIFEHTELFARCVVRASAFL